jgi:hypothetical protein
MARIMVKATSAKAYDDLMIVAFRRNGRYADDQLGNETVYIEFTLVYTPSKGG